jgi:hypothetical protein
MPDVMWVRYVPLDGFLVWLVAGWRLPFIVEPCGGHHRPDQPMPEVEQVQAPHLTGSTRCTKGGSRSGGADDGAGDRVMRLKPRGILRLFSRA